MRVLVALAACLMLTSCATPAHSPDEDFTPADQFHVLLMQDSEFWSTKTADSTYAVAKDVCRLLDGGYSTSTVTSALIAEEDVPDQAAADLVAAAQRLVC